MVFLTVIVSLQFFILQSQGLVVRRDNVSNAFTTGSLQEGPPSESDALMETILVTSSNLTNEKNSLKSRLGKFMTAPLKRFGKRPFGNRSRFRIPQSSHLEWVGYFLEETIVPVLMSKSDRTMADCVVIEVGDEWEQKTSMEFFGSMMKMVPLPISDMIHVTTLCGLMSKNRVHVSAPSPIQKNNLNQAVGSQSNPTFILPGTLWCGVRDKGKQYEFLGDQMELDSCCRTHDHCPIKVGSFKSRYGATNYGIGTSSHCLCDLEFYRCLKRVGNEKADMVGSLFFNVLKMNCIHDPPSSKNVNHLPIAQGRYHCMHYDKNKNCHFWGKNLNYEYNLKSDRTTLIY